MRYFTLLAAGALAVAVSTSAGAGSIGSAGLSNIDLSQIELAQEKKKEKSEPVKEKVKRIWRNWTGYKFEVACPAFPIVLSRTTCTATGKNREEARAKCRAQHGLCSVREISR